MNPKVTMFLRCDLLSRGLRYEKATENFRERHFVRERPKTHQTGTLSRRNGTESPLERALRSSRTLLSERGKGTSSHRAGNACGSTFSRTSSGLERQGCRRSPRVTWSPCGASPVSILRNEPVPDARFARSAIFWKPTSSQESLRGGKSFSRLPGLKTLRGNQRARHDPPCSFAGENLREETRPGDAFHEEGNL
jgi:hypothetical protein